MTEEVNQEEEVQLSEEQVQVIQKAYRRPVVGVVIDTIIGFERSLQVPEEPSVEEAPPVEVPEEEMVEEPHTYAEYLRFYRAQEAEKKVEEEEE